MTFSRIALALHLHFLLLKRRNDGSLIRPPRWLFSGFLQLSLGHDELHWLALATGNLRIVNNFGGRRKNG